MKRHLYSPTTADGFTLIEVLVSVFLLGIMSALCYGTLNYVMKARTITQDSFARLRGVEMTMHYLVTDVSQMTLRPVRDSLGEITLPTLLADPRNTALLSLTRGGWTNWVGLPRSTQQRVTYRLEQETLIREYLPVLDATLSTTPTRQSLLTGVKQITVRYLDGARAWQTQWPVLNLDGAMPDGSGVNLPLRTRPLAIEVVIELQDFGSLRRVIEVPG
jgi:general secretion pathway protein J